MAGKLKRRDKNQISQWIGGNKQFELLYKLSRDGGTAQRFHDLCDNKGPTVTIFYNTDNNVYGGYLSESWESSGVNWCTDPRAFLFKLYSSGNWKPMEFPYVTKETHYKWKTNGPCFYSLTSFGTFITTTTEQASMFYNLSTSAFFDGQRFDMKGETVQSVANGHNKVTDLEVYLVKEGSPKKELDSPWRDPPEWSSKTFQELKEFAATYQPLEEAKLPEVNILLIGPVGAGKSSFVNTINSVYKGELSSRACAGGAVTGLTQRIGNYRVRDPSTKKFLSFKICDTRGIEEATTINRESLRCLLDGNLPNDYNYGLDSEVSTKTPGFVKEPTLKDRIHVVVFFLDGSTLDVLSEGVVTKLQEIKRLVVDRGVPHLTFLTKIDKISDLVEKDTSKTFTSSVIEDAINEAADIMYLPRSQVLPVKNYEKEANLDTNINILALMALKKALLFADDYLENQFDWQQVDMQKLSTKD